MKKIIAKSMAALFSVIMIAFVMNSCQKSSLEPSPSLDLRKTDPNSEFSKFPDPENYTFNLQVILRGRGKSFGLIKFRQDPDAAKVITLDTWVRGLKPNHAYLLQRAVDTELDCNCTGTGWLTLGKGVVMPPQPITTNEKGTGWEQLWRDVTAIPSGTEFDIHFQILDAETLTVVLTSDCYHYTVR